MRLVESTLSPQGKGQYLLALGVRDIELMLGEAENAYRFFPKTPDRKEDRERLGGIVRGLQEARDAAKALEDDGEKIPLDKRYRFRDEYLKNINRFEVIDHRACTACKGKGFILNSKNNGKGMLCAKCEGGMVRGRDVIFWDNKTRITSSVQDNGKTLKVFISDKPTKDKDDKEPAVLPKSPFGPDFDKFIERIARDLNVI